MAEPTANSYVVTVFLQGVKKGDALQLARIFEQGALLAKDVGKLGEVTVLASHVKDVSE